MRGFEIHGISRPVLSPSARKNQDELKANKTLIKLWACDLSCFDAVREVVAAIRPDQLYHLAAAHVSSQSQIAGDLTEGDRRTFEENVSSAINLLCAIREVAPNCRYVGAGSCLMYDAAAVSPQNETLAWQSRSSYGLAKIAAANWVRFCRHAYGIHASTAVLYNHESPRRGEQFVTQKIVKALVAIKKGYQTTLKLGSLDATKDWGHARDTVRALILMAEASQPDDYIVATGVGRTVGFFLESVSKRLGILDWRPHVVLQESITRANQSDVALIGDPGKIKTRLAWQTEISFDQMIDGMIKAAISGGSYGQ